MNSTDTLKRAALYKAIDYLMADPEHNIPKAMELVNRHAPHGLFPSQRAAFTVAIKTRSNWYQLLLRIAALNPDMIGDLVKTLVVDANFIAWEKQERSRDRYGCNVPWAILLDPTSACNLHCTGCWAAGYGHNLNLTLEDIDSVIEQGTELGVHIYIYTGGEPLVRKHDIVRLCEKHPDCVFLCFTNATLIDEQFCRDMVRIKNFIPAISVEGREETTDARRGAGTYRRIVRAMELLRSHRLPFGISACCTRRNVESICCEDYFDWIIEQGALFCWLFTFMPVGSGAEPDMIPTARQRERMLRFVRRMREEKPLFTIDFQNDGEYVGGCIAGGRRYLHINAAGDVEPCVFVHYSNANIHSASLLEALRSPIFMQYYERQPFSGNHLMPCPMLENPSVLPQMVADSGARSTDLIKPETPEELREKCFRHAAAWAPVAERLWNDSRDPHFPKRSEARTGMAESDMRKFAALGRDPREGGVL